MALAIVASLPAGGLGGLQPEDLRSSRRLPHPHHSRFRDQPPVERLADDMN